MLMSSPHEVGNSECSTGIRERASQCKDNFDTASTQTDQTYCSHKYIQCSNGQDDTIFDSITTAYRCKDFNTLFEVASKGHQNIPNESSIDIQNPSRLNEFLRRVSSTMELLLDDNIVVEESNKVSETYQENRPMIEKMEDGGITYDHNNSNERMQIFVGMDFRLKNSSEQRIDLDYLTEEREIVQLTNSNSYVSSFS